jgi:hypothetical protein
MPGPALFEIPERPFERTTLCNIKPRRRRAPGQADKIVQEKENPLVTIAEHSKRI